MISNINLFLTIEKVKNDITKKTRKRYVSLSILGQAEKEVLVKDMGQANNVRPTTGLQLLYSLLTRANM